MVGFCLALAGAPAVALAGAPAVAQPTGSDGDAWIGIRVVDGDGEFYQVASGETWVPCGTNLMRFDRGGPEAPFSMADYDPAWIETQLDDLAAKGYNAVRVFFERCVTDLDCTAGPGQRLSGEFLERAAEFLRLAAARDIHVMYSSNTLPTNSWYVWEGYPEGDSDFVSARNVEVYQIFFRDFVEGLIAHGAPMDWLWSLEIRNEYQYLTADWPPWNLSEGMFTAANGESYDMGVRADRRRLSSDSLLHWADEMTAVIKSVDPDLLVSIGLLLLPSDDVGPPGSDDQRNLVVGPFHERTTVDFFDIHGILPSVEEARTAFSLPASREKPVIIGEFAGEWGTPDVVAWVAVRWQARTCQAGFDGWLTWHWQWVADTDIDAALNPRDHPDPCVRGRGRDPAGEPGPAGAGVPQRGPRVSARQPRRWRPRVVLERCCGQPTVVRGRSGFGRDAGRVPPAHRRGDTARAGRYPGAGQGSGNRWTVSAVASVPAAHQAR